MEKKQKKGSKVWKLLRRLLLKTLTIALAVYLLFTHIIGVCIVPNGDMYPRMGTGDVAFFYRLDTKPKAQDIVVLDKAVTDRFYPVEYEGYNKPWWRQALDWIGFKDPNEPEKKRFICRVVAAPGDVVEITEDQRLFINGNAMVESGIFYRTSAYVGYTKYPVKLGPEEYFVLADFRSGGVDSRFFGTVKRDEIQGVLVTIVKRHDL